MQRSFNMYNKMPCRITDEWVVNPWDSEETELDNFYDLSVGKIANSEMAVYIQESPRSRIEFDVIVESEREIQCESKAVTQEELESIALFCESFLKSYKCLNR